VPGDQLRLEVDIARISRSIWKYRGRASVDGQTTAEAELMCTLREIDTGRPANPPEDA
jgi:3-hydroxyacyl-[acyl-carrier-protein] dehydratase